MLDWVAIAAAYAEAERNASRGEGLEHQAAARRERGKCELLRRDEPLARKRLAGQAVLVAWETMPVPQGNLICAGMEEAHTPKFSADAARRAKGARRR